MSGPSARVALPPAMSGASYDAANQLVSWAGTAYGYDANGNLSSDGIRSYTWDARDRLTGLAGGGITAAFGYDAFDRRRSRTVSGTTAKFLYDGANVVHTLSATNVVNTTLLNGAGLDERYARTTVPGGVTSAYLTDALGSTLALVSSTGSTTASFTYEPYGVATKTGSDDTTFRYTGREDDGTGLLYYRARYVFPRTGRFISQDPIGLAGGENLYAYVSGNPVLFSDPRGLNPFVGAIEGAAAGSTFGPGGTIVGGVIGAAVGGWIGWNVMGPMLSSGYPPGYWSADKGAAEWGRRNNVGAKEGRGRFHQIKQKCPGGSKPDESFGVNPVTGDVIDPDGHNVGNLEEVKSK
jgi:RHS repeat-associated protein